MTSKHTTRAIQNTQHEVARLDRAMACLRFAGQRTRNAWLKSLCHRKWWEAASAQKLRSCGYHISLRTTRDWRVF